jgi:hypothetical protein
VFSDNSPQLHLSSLQSQDDWHVLWDIACCNPSFHGRPGYDCVIINIQSVTYAHLCFVFKCFLDTRSSHDIALAQLLKPSKWAPKGESMLMNAKLFAVDFIFHTLSLLFISGLGNSISSVSTAARRCGKYAFSSSR